MGGGQGHGQALTALHGLKKGRQKPNLLSPIRRKTFNVRHSHALRLHPVRISVVTLATLPTPPTRYCTQWCFHLSSIASLVSLPRPNATPVLLTTLNHGVRLPRAARLRC